MTIAIANLGDFKILTFDVWNTLIKANPEFSRLRTQMIADTYDIPYEMAKEAYTSVKFFLDTSAEVARIGMATHQCWDLLDSTVQRLRRKNDMEYVASPSPKALMFASEEMFRARQPIFTQDTKDLLARLKDRGCSLGIISNTNFIRGDVLFDTLFKDLGVFDYALFSDSFGVPKPHGKIFNTMSSQPNLHLETNGSRRRQPDLRLCSIDVQLRVPTLSQPRRSRPHFQIGRSLTCVSKHRYSHIRSPAWMIWASEPAITPN